MAEKQLPTFYDIPEASWNRFEERIRASKTGRLIILVHPNFVDYPPEKYLAVVKKLSEQNKTPVLILEEAHKAGALVGRFSSLKHPPLVVPTSSKNPWTLLDGSLALYDAGRSKVDNEHRLLAEQLRRLGARTILIGGTYSWPWLTHDADVTAHERDIPLKKLFLEHMPELQINGGCVGRTYSLLITHLGACAKIRLIPGGVHPDKPHYVDWPGMQRAIRETWVKARTSPQEE